MACYENICLLVQGDAILCENKNIAIVGGLTYTEQRRREVVKSIDLGCLLGQARDWQLCYKFAATGASIRHTHTFG